MRDVRSFHRQISVDAKKSSSSRSLADEDVSQFAVPIKIIDSEVTDDFELELLRNDGTWHRSRIALTEKYVLISKPQNANVVDVIPFGDITDAHDICEESYLPLTMDDHESINMLQINTDVDGYNCGRIYRFRKSPESFEQSLLLAIRKHLITENRKNSWAKTLEKFQRKLRALFDSKPVQSTIAFLTMSNFVLNIVETQFIDDISNLDGSLTLIGTEIRILNIFFLGVFIVELLMNLIANWWRRFFRSPWNLLDVAMVLSGVLSTFSLHLVVLRLLRIARVLRIFGKVRVLREIISALASSLIPMASAFFILVIMMCMYAILGVSLFSQMAPEAFGKFNRAFVTMFRVTAGDTWVDGMPTVLETGDLNQGFAAFITSYVIVVVWLVLQVSVAILLDNFVSSAAQIKREDEQAEADEHRRVEEGLNPLLRLALHLAQAWPHSLQRSPPDAERAEERTVTGVNTAVLRPELGFSSPNLSTASLPGSDPQTYSPLGSIGQSARKQHPKASDSSAPRETQAFSDTHDLACRIRALFKRISPLLHINLFDYDAFIHLSAQPEHGPSVACEEEPTIDLARFESAIYTLLRRYLQSRVALHAAHPEWSTGDSGSADLLGLKGASLEHAELMATHRQLSEYVLKAMSHCAPDQIAAAWAVISQKTINSFPPGGGGGDDLADRGFYSRARKHSKQQDSDPSADAEEQLADKSIEHPWIESNLYQSNDHGSFHSIQQNHESHQPPGATNDLQKIEQDEEPEGDSQCGHGSLPASNAVMPEGKLNGARRRGKEGNAGSGSAKRTSKLQLNLQSVATQLSAGHMVPPIRVLKTLNTTDEMRVHFKGEKDRSTHNNEKSWGNHHLSLPSADEISTIPESDVSMAGPGNDRTGQPQFIQLCSEPSHNKSSSSNVKSGKSPAVTLRSRSPQMQTGKRERPTSAPDLAGPGTGRRLFLRSGPLLFSPRRVSPFSYQTTGGASARVDLRDATAGKRTTRHTTAPTTALQESNDLVILTSPTDFEPDPARFNRDRHDYSISR